MAKSHEQRLLNRNELRRRKQNAQGLGFEFRLSETSIVAGEEQVARVRRITLTDQASINQLPDTLQRVVNDGLAYVENEQKRVQEEGLSTDTLEDRVKNNTRLLPAADAFCLATFVEPKLVATEAELAQFPDAWLVADIEPADRIDWFMACLNADSEAAKKLKPFRPKSVIDVEARPESHDVRDTAASPAPVAHGDEREPYPLVPRG